MRNKMPNSHNLEPEKCQKNVSNNYISAAPRQVDQLREKRKELCYAAGHSNDTTHILWYVSIRPEPKIKQAHLHMTSDIGAPKIRSPSCGDQFCVWVSVPIETRKVRKVNVAQPPQKCNQNQNGASDSDLEWMVRHWARIILFSNPVRAGGAAGYPNPQHNSSATKML